MIKETGNSVSGYSAKAGGTMDGLVPVLTLLGLWIAVILMPVAGGDAWGGDL